MTDILRQFSDDQLALLGCLGALSASFLILWTSFRLGTRDPSTTTVPAPARTSDETQQTTSTGQRHAA